MNKYFYEMVANSLNGVVSNITNSEDWKKKDADAKYTDVLDAINSTIDEIERDYPEEVANENAELDDDVMWYDDVRNDVMEYYLYKFC